MTIANFVSFAFLAATAGAIVAVAATRRGRRWAMKYLKESWPPPPPPMGLPIGVPFAVFSFRVLAPAGIWGLFVWLAMRQLICL